MPETNHTTNLASGAYKPRPFVVTPRTRSFNLFQPPTLPVTTPIPIDAAPETDRFEKIVVRVAAPKPAHSLHVSYQDTAAVQLAVRIRAKAARPVAKAVQAAPMKPVVKPAHAAEVITVKVVRKQPPAGTVIDFVPIPKLSVVKGERPEQMTRYDTHISATVQPVRAVPQAATVESAVAMQEPAAHETSAEDDGVEQVLGEAIRNRGLRSLFAPALASLVLLVGLGIFGMTYKVNKQAIIQVAHASAASEQGEGAAGGPTAPPSEQAVTSAAVGSYKVAPDMPQTVRIDKIGVNARIKRLTVLKDGSLATPGNVADAGWYEGSSRPGDGGAVLLAGHVSGPTLPGVFGKIKNLNVGDTITITRGDNQQYSYKVVKKAQIPADKLDMSDLLVPVTPGRSGLNMITCGGKYLIDTETYQDRVVIYAEQIDNR
jgi:sortase (surface protein transpeptidase)